MGPRPTVVHDLFFQRSIEKYQTARRLGGPVIFDRGIPDCIVYADRAEVVPRPSLEAAEGPTAITLTYSSSSPGRRLMRPTRNGS